MVELCAVWTKGSFQRLCDSDLQVNLLVNNAGFGLRGEFRSLTLEQQTDMMRLNNVAAIELTYRLLPRLLQSSQSGIINLASAAGFQPMPYAALYGATKSFLISFSMALQEELRNRGVCVVTLCPGRILHRDLVRKPASLIAGGVLLRSSTRAFERTSSAPSTAGWVIGGTRGAVARLCLKRTTLIAKMKKLGIRRPALETEFLHSSSDESKRQLRYVKLETGIPPSI
jgi:uncharacterized protein